MARSYPRVKAGEWQTPTRHGYKMACCDCGLVHKLDFRLVTDQRGRTRIQFRAFRDNRATAGIRRRREPHAATIRAVTA